MIITASPNNYCSTVSFNTLKYLQHILLTYPHQQVITPKLISQSVTSLHHAINIFTTGCLIKTYFVIFITM